MYLFIIYYIKYRFLLFWRSQLPLDDPRLKTIIYVYNIHIYSDGLTDKEKKYCKNVTKTN